KQYENGRTRSINGLDGLTRFTMMVIDLATGKPDAPMKNGEGWHNNHHAEPRCAAHGRRWWELDVSYLSICGLERVRSGLRRRETKATRSVNPQGVPDRGVGLPVGLTPLALAACRPPVSRPRRGSSAPLGPWPAPASPAFPVNG